MVRATAELPLPSPLTARPSSNIVSTPTTSGRIAVLQMLLMKQFRRFLVLLLSYLIFFFTNRLSNVCPSTETPLQSRAGV